MEIHTIGIDLGKTVFHLVGVNVRGEVVARKKCSRTQLLRFTSNLRKGRGRSAFHSGKEIATPIKAGYIRADQFCHPHFSLAKRRRTIHSE
jgi:hypothetical protein